MKYNKFGFVLLAAAAAMIISCGGNDENKQHYDNKLFISASGFAREMLIEENAVEMSNTIETGIAKPENRDISVSFRAAPELIDTYRKAYYDESVLLLPDIHYDLSQAGTEIPAGKVAGDPLSIDFVDLDRLDLESRYVLPVTIASANIDILQSAKTLYYIFKEASLVNVAADINDNWLWPDWKDAAPVTDMSAFTLEALVFGYAFKNPSGLSTIMGIEDIFLIRVGDANIPINQLQVAYGTKDAQGSIKRGSITNASMKLLPERWYHIAVTFDNGAIKVYLDGKERAVGDVATDPGITSVDFGVEHSDEAEGKPRCFWIGYSYDAGRCLNGMIAETRIWNKALTAEDIAAPNHFYKVDSAADGLVSYWKFDEGSGNDVKDHSRWGNDLSVREDHDLKWVAVSLPEKK